MSSQKHDSKSGASVELGSPPHLGRELVHRLLGSTADVVLHCTREGEIRYFRLAETDPVWTNLAPGMSALNLFVTPSQSLLKGALADSFQAGWMPPLELESVDGRCFLGRVCFLDSHDSEGDLLLTLVEVTRLKQEKAQALDVARRLEARMEESEASLAREKSRREMIESRLVQSHGLESLGALASGVAHEYNNLLAVILGNAGLAQMLLPQGSPAREAIQHLETATLHAAELTNQLLTYSGHARVKTEQIDLSQAVVELSALIEAGLKGGRLLELDCATGIGLFLGDLGQIQKAMMHLVRQASANLGEDSGVVRLRTFAVDLSQEDVRRCTVTEGVEPGSYVALEVCDGGRRLSELELSHFFEPFSPHRPQTDGLGVAAVLGIVRSYGGTVKVSSDDQGNRVSLFFPVHLGPSNLDSLPDKPVLLIDDELTVRGTVGSLLKQLGYRVVALDGGLRALEYLQEHPSQVAAVLLDANMPGLSGVDCFDSIRQLDPEVPIVVMSGYSEERIRAEFRGRELKGLLKKPFRFSELDRVVSMAVGGR